MEVVKYVPVVLIKTNENSGVKSESSVISWIKAKYKKSIDIKTE